MATDHLSSPRIPVKWNEIHQFFLQHPVKPVNGVVTLSAQPGIGMELDETKIEKRIELRY